MSVDLKLVWIKPWSRNVLLYLKLSWIPSEKLVFQRELSSIMANILLIVICPWSWNHRISHIRFAWQEHFIISISPCCKTEGLLLVPMISVHIVEACFELVRIRGRGICKLIRRR